MPSKMAEEWKDNRESCRTELHNSVNPRVVPFLEQTPIKKTGVDSCILLTNPYPATGPILAKLRREVDNSTPKKCAWDRRRCEASCLPSHRKQHHRSQLELHYPIRCRAPISLLLSSFGCKHVPHRVRHLKATSSPGNFLFLFEDPLSCLRHSTR